MNHCDYYNRPVYKSELQDYWRKTDYFEGLSDLEKEEIRQNLGIYGGSSNSNLAELSECTFSEFNSLRKNDKLIVGKRYLINDFRTIYYSNVKSGDSYEVWGGANSTNPSEVYQLLVTAINCDQIDPRVFVQGKDWVVEYNPVAEQLDASNWTMGTITFLKDEHNNVAHYDFKNIRFRKTVGDLQGLIITNKAIDFYTFSRLVNNVAYDNSDNDDVHNNYFGDDCCENIIIGDANNNIFGSNVCRNLFLKGIEESNISAGSRDNVISSRVVKTNGQLIEIGTEHNDEALSSNFTKTLMNVESGIVATWLDQYSYSWQISVIKDSLTNR